MFIWYYDSEKILMYMKIRDKFHTHNTWKKPDTIDCSLYIYVKFYVVSFEDKAKGEWENNTINNRIMNILGEEDMESIMIERKD